MARHAPMQQRETTSSTTTARESRPRRAREERAQQRANAGSNQRNLRKQKRAEQTPDADAQASEIATLLRDDADDQSGQARARLESLPENERAEVTARLQTEMSESDMQRAAPMLARPAPHVVQPQPGEPAQKKEEARATPDVQEAEEAQEAQEAEETEAAEENGEAEVEKKEAAKKKRGASAPLRVVPVAEKEAPAEGAGEGEAAAPETKSVEETKAPVDAKAAEIAAVPAPAVEAKGPAAEAKPAAEPGPTAIAPAAARGAAPAAASAAPAAPVAMGGGGGGGGEAATLDEAPPESAEAEETEEKMAEAEPETDETESAEPEPRDEELSADKAMEDAENAPPSEVEEQAKAAEEEEAAARTGGGGDAASEEAEEEEAPPAESVELPAAERDAALGSLGEEAAGGGEPGGGGGGGGGGGAAAEPTAEEPPDVSSAPPAAAMATVSSLKVGQIAGAISSVSASVTNKVTEEKSDLAANAPSMERPSGAPQTKDARSEGAEGGEGGSEAKGVEEVAAEGETPSAEEQLEPLAEPGPDPTAQVAAPRVSGGGEGGTMSAADVENLESAIEDLPTTDPALEETAGPPPTVELVGEADPALAAEQRTQLEETTAGLEAEGSADAAKPMGEDELYPVVPQETLTAKIEGGAGGGDGASVEVDDDTAAIVAEEEEGDGVRAEAAAAQAEMTAAEGEHETEVATKNAEHDAAVDEAVAANEEQQTARRNSAKADVEAKRGEWTSEQRAMVDQSRGDADAAMEESDATVEREQSSADERAEEEIEKGNEEAAAARKDAERDAKKEKDSADSEGGFFDWVASAATSFFNGLKAAIGAIFDAARALVKGAIELAQKAAAAIIDAARDAIIAGIRLAGDACMLAADFLLAGFPELRDRVKGAIQDTVSAAEDAVNEFADELKRGVQELLDALGKALDAALSLLEKGLMAAVDAVAAAVEGAIKAAKAAIAALALFATLIKDIAADPGGWISNLGAAILDGIQNHLWKELKAAVKAWFNAKLDAVLGIGTAIWDVLKKGKITAAQIGKMAFEALKAAIPMMLIQLIVEKVASMIVPAFGAVMVIVESLQAAWGAISAIITAVGKFIDFLKAVRGGGAGPQFAQAMAAGAVAVIEFVSSFLLVKLIGPAKKVGGKVKAMAGRIMAKLKKLGAKIARAAKKLVGKIKKGLKKLGKKLGFGKKKKSRTKKDKEKATDRLAKAMREIPPRVEGMAGDGVARMLLSARLLYWRARYRLSSLRLVANGQTVVVEGTANPTGQGGALWTPDREWLRTQVHNVTEAILKDPRIVRKANRIANQSGDEDDPIKVSGKGGYAALARQHRRGKNQRDPFVKGEERHYDVGGSPVKESSGSMGVGGTNARVHGVGSGTYKDMPDHIEAVAEANGVDPATILGAVRGVAFGKKGIDPELRAQVAPLAHLMMGRESIRNPQSLVYSTMTLDLLGRSPEEGGITTKEAFAKKKAVMLRPAKRTKTSYRPAKYKVGTGGGMLPMSMQGAAATAAELEDERLSGGDPKDRSDAAKEMAAREAKLVERWLMAEFGMKQLTWPMKKQSAAQAKIRKKIRDKMLQAFGLK